MQLAIIAPYYDSSERNFLGMRSHACLHALLLVMLSIGGASPTDSVKAALYWKLCQVLFFTGGLI